MLHFVDEDTNLVGIYYFSIFMLEASLILCLFSFYSFQSSLTPTFPQSTTSTFREPVVHKIHVVSEVTVPQAFQATDPPNILVVSKAPIPQPRVYHYLNFWFLLFYTTLLKFVFLISIGLW